MFEKIKIRISNFIDLISLGSANLTVIGFSGIFWLYIAPILGKESYGEVNYYIALAGIGLSVSSLGLNNLMTVLTAKGIKIQHVIYLIGLISSSTTAVILFILVSNFNVSLFVIGAVIFTFSCSELLGLKLYKKYSKIIILQRALAVIFAISLYYIIGPNGIIMGFALSFFPLSFRFYRFMADFKIEFTAIKPHVGFMMSSYGLELTRTLNWSIDKILIFPMFGFEILGTYQLGIQFLSILVILPGTMYNYLLPRDSTGVSHKKLKIISIITSILLAVIMILVSPFIIRQFFPNFIDSILAAQIMSIAIVPLTINTLFASKLLGIEKSKIVFTASIIYLTTLLSSIIMLGNYYGLYGLAMSPVISAIIETIFYVIIQFRSKLIK